MAAQKYSYILKKKLGMAKVTRSNGRMRNRLSRLWFGRFGCSCFVH
jgi:hypothetical protein